MRITSKVIWPFIMFCALCAGSSIFVFGATPAQTLNLPDSVSDYAVEGDDIPDVTARVARISFLKGEAQIRRADGGDWEKAALNLPVVEGDEITTASNSRLEIQFDNNQHLRLAENAYLKIVNLKDAGIAISLSLGTMSVRVTRFDKDKAFFEVDAPKTTLAVQKAGVYRIDAGQQNDTEIRVSVTENGEARVYSDSAGFTLKNGRSARVFIDGINAGEWEAADSSRYLDEFDSWSLERDSTIAKRLKDAYYDKYYDQNIYGADDLDGHGEWIHTSKYGNVWRPYRNSTIRYDDWSPYRYGHWRWIPPFGWTWVNDEPWGWATYHHGRWLYDDGYWAWSPYGYYRQTRSWWFPALVVLNVFNNNVCWYPLPYHHNYYNYNYSYNCHRGRRGCHSGGHNGGYNGGGHQPPTIHPTGGIKVPKPPVPTKIPPSAVVAMGTVDFGTTVKTIRTAPLGVANSVISKKVDDMGDPVLPAYSAIKISRNIAAERPKTDIVAAQTKVGAAPRKQNVPMDDELRSVRVFGGRPPLTDTGGVRTMNNSPSDTRKTGAVTRQTAVKQNNSEPPVRHPPVYMPPVKTGDDSGSQPTRTPRYNPPVKQDPPRTDPPVRQPPRSEPPVRQPPRSEPAPPTRQPPRTEPAPPTKQPPRSEPSPPTRQPPVKSAPPKQENKPSKAPDGGSKKAKDD